MSADTGGAGSSKSPQRYTDKPLPKTWLPVLNRHWAPVRKAARVEPGLQIATAIDVFLHDFDERTRTILTGRLSGRHTLEELGQALGGLSRERIRQIEDRALADHAESAAIVLEGIGIKDWVPKNSLKVFNPTQAAPDLWRDAQPIEMWRFMAALYSKFEHAPLVISPVNNEICLAHGSRVIEDVLRRLFLTEVRFRRAEELAEALGISVADLQSVWMFLEGLQLTETGLYSWTGWSHGDRIEAVAWQLEEAGIVEWHFSEMEKALKVVWPEEFKDYPSRNVAAILSRPSEERFCHTGRKGIWSLCAAGDGFDGNLAAVTAVLQAAGEPLHHEEILSRLQRDVAPATIYALLIREDNFTEHGNGIYGLRNDPEATGREEARGKQQVYQGPDSAVSPPTWDEAIQGLIPVKRTSSKEIPVAPPVSEMLDSFLWQYSPEVRRVLRFAATGSLASEEASQALEGLPAGAVDQVVDGFVKNHRSNALIMFNDLRKFIAGSPVTVCVPTARDVSQYLPELSAGDLLQVAVGLCQLVLDNDVHAMEQADGVWVLRRQGTWLNALKAMFDGEPRFKNADILAGLFKVEVSTVLESWSALDELSVTQGGLIGSAQWALADRIKAIAVHLAGRRLFLWQAGQMLQALRTIWPSDCMNYSEAEVRGLLLETKGVFHQLKGGDFWCLQEHHEVANQQLPAEHVPELTDPIEALYAGIFGNAESRAGQDTEPALC